MGGTISAKIASSATMLVAHQETITWLQKAKMRGLITHERYEELSDELTEIRKMLNGYIRSIGKNTNS